MGKVHETLPKRKGTVGWEKGRSCEKKRVSEAGNRTPVVRVTGGNTKPLYYFGPVMVSIVDIMRRRKGKEGNG